MPSLILVLGDQLSLSMSSLKDANPESDIVLMAEVMEEATYVGHHKKKLAFVFSAMRHFAHELEKKGFSVRYVHLTDKNNQGALRAEVSRAIEDRHSCRISRVFQLTMTTDSAQQGEGSLVVEVIAR